MTNTPSQKTEKKKQKNSEKKSPISPHALIGFREAARELQGHAPLKNRGKNVLEVVRLLRGLATGAVQSGFVLQIEPFIWVSIPISYWDGVSEKKFKVIRHNDDGEGGYFVKLSQFPAECAAALVARDAISPPDNDWIEATLRETLAKAARRHEVKLWRNESWKEYKEQMLSEALANGQIQSVRGSGVKEKAGWKVLYRIIAAYKIAKKTDMKNKTTFVAMVLEQAHRENEANIDLPAHKAVMDEVTALDDYVKRIL